MTDELLELMRRYGEACMAAARWHDADPAVAEQHRARAAAIYERAAELAASLAGRGEAA